MCIYHVCTLNVHVLPCRNAFCGQIQCKSDGTFQVTGGLAVSYSLNSGVICRYTIMAYQRCDRLYVGRTPTHLLTLTQRMAQNSSYKPFTYMYSMAYSIPTKTLKVVLPCIGVICHHTHIHVHVHVAPSMHCNAFFCRTVTEFASSEEISPGLIQDGTKCGDEMVCVGIHIHACIMQCICTCKQVFGMKAVSKS